MHRNGYLGASVDPAFWPSHSVRRLRFLIRRVYFCYPMTFAAYILCFRAEISFDLVTMTFDLLTLAMSDELRITLPINIAIFSILQLSVPELYPTQSDRITFTWDGQCACAVSRDLSPTGKNYPRFRTPWTKFTYSLGHFVTKIKSWKRRKSVLPSSRLQSLLHMCSIKWPVYGDPP